MSGRAVLDLGQLLALLRPARDRKAAIVVLNEKVRPEIARMNKAQLRAALSQAVLNIHRLQVENESFVETQEQAEALHPMRLKRLFEDVRVADIQGGIKAVSKQGRRARSGRDAKLNPVRDHAFQLATDGQYKSLGRAARSIAREVIEFAEAHHIKMSEEEAPTTIEGWLRMRGWEPRRSIT